MFKEESSEYRHNSSITKWYPKDLNSARAIAFYNLSVSYAIRGEIDMAYRNFNIVSLLHISIYFQF